MRCFAGGAGGGGGLRCLQEELLRECGVQGVGCVVGCGTGGGRATTRLQARQALLLVSLSVFLSFFLLTDGAFPANASSSTVVIVVAERSQRE